MMSNLLRFLSLRWKLILIIACAIGAVSYVVVPVVVVFSEINNYFSLDKTENKHSPYHGRKLRLAPFAHFYRMEGWSGWTDNYLHLYTRPPKLGGGSDVVFQEVNSSATDEKGFWDLRVKQVLHKTSGMGLGGRDEICVLENIRAPDELSHISCAEIPWAEAVTETFTNVTRELDRAGMAYVLFFDANDEIEKKFSMHPLLKFNFFRLHKVMSRDQFINILMAGDEHDYSQLYTVLPTLSPDGSRLAESLLGKIYIPNTKYITHCRWREDCKTLSDYMLINEIPLEVERFITETYPENFVNRWALRIAAADIGHVIRGDRHPNSIRFRLTLHQGLLDCLKDLSVGTRFYTNYKEVLQIYLKEFKLEKEWAELKEIDSNYVAMGGSGEFQCNYVEPPYAFGEGVFF